MEDCMTGFRTNVMGLEVLALPRLVTRVERLEVEDAGTADETLDGFPGGRGRWASICIGGRNREKLCDFAASVQVVAMPRPPGPPTLKVGFIQVLLRTHRVAKYRATGARPGAPPLCTVSRDANRVGVGLLDCGTDAPPWFGASVEDVPRPALGGALPAPPVSINAGDNPRWTIPAALPTQRGAAELDAVEMRDHFRLFVVAFDGRAYHPIAQTEWGTDIRYVPTAGRPTAGALSGRKVWSDGAWTGTCQGLITTGSTANKLLGNRFA